MELSEYLKLSNTKSAKAARKRAEERARREEQERRSLVLESIGRCGDYTDEEKEFIYQINERVMSVDGTAEGWGYDCDPMNYVGTSAGIFDLAKEFFTGIK